MTRQDLRGKLAVDTSALIELIYCEAPGQKLKQALEKEAIEAWTRARHNGASVHSLQKTWVGRIL